MTIFSNTIFKPISNYIKFGNSSIVVQNGANVLEKLNLCNIKVQYKQYQKTMVTIPAGTTDYLLSFPMLGIKSTFIAIKATYKTKNPTKNYLKWKFSSSNDPHRSMTNILVFTGTASNPVDSIYLDNPNDKCSVDLEILIAGVDNDYLEDVNAFLYLDELELDAVQTFNQTNSGILAFYNSDGDLVGTTDASDVVNWYKVQNMNRIVIDESTNNNIILDFKTQYDTLQTLSAINWLMLDVNNRSLPTPPDLLPPVITLTSSTLNIDLNNYTNMVYDKNQFITDAIASIIDVRDGNIIAINQNIKFFDSNNAEVLSISSAGTFTAEITVSDIAGNIETDTVTINATYNLLDTTPPVITYNSNVSVPLSMINSFDLQLLYNGTFNKSDAILLCVSSIVDDFDGVMNLNTLTVNFYQNSILLTGNITTAGLYEIEFSVSDSAMNQTIDIFQIQII